MSDKWEPGFDLRWSDFESGEWRDAAMSTAARREEALVTLRQILPPLFDAPDWRPFLQQIVSVPGDFGPDANSRDFLLRLVDDNVKPADYTERVFASLIAKHTPPLPTQDGLAKILESQCRAAALDAAFSDLKRGLSRYSKGLAASKEKAAMARALSALAVEWVPKFVPWRAEGLLTLAYLYAEDREATLGGLLKELTQDPDAPQWLRHRAKGEWYYDEDGNTIYGIEPK